MATLPSFRTWVAGEVVTAAYMNANIRDAGTFFLAPPIAELRQTVAQSFTTGTPAGFLLDTEDMDTDGGHSTVTNTSRYTSPTAGVLQVSGGGGWVANATGNRIVYMKENGADLAGSAVETLGVSGVPLVLAARTKHVTVNGSTDYVEIVGQQGSGGNLNSIVSGVETQATMSVRFVHS